MTHATRTIQGHTVTVTGPDAEGLMRRMFTPLSQSDVVAGFCKQPHEVQFVSVFNAGVRFAESAHGITGETK